MSEVLLCVANVQQTGLFSGQAASLFFSQTHLPKTTAELRNGDLEDWTHQEEEKGSPAFFAGPGSDPSNNMHLR